MVENTVFHLRLAESAARNLGLTMYVLKKICGKWTHTVQTHVVRGSTVISEDEVIQEYGGPLIHLTGK